MHKAKHKHSEFDLHDDLAKIKAALAAATYDARGRVRELLSESLDGVKEKSTEVQDTVSDYVTDKPLKSIGFAMLAGVIVGYLLHK